MADKLQTSAMDEDVSLEDRRPDSEVDATQVEEKGNESAHETDVDGGVIVRASDMTAELLGKKKRKKKKKTRSAGKRGLNRPTGFEEYHADAPLTPEQFAESREAFNPDIPFVDRVLKAIQRFERTRKLSSERRDIFYKYLAYGGIDIGPNMFVGAQDTEDMDRDDTITSMAQTSISTDTKQSLLDPKYDQSKDVESAGHKAKYVVDFEGTVRAFLSRRAPSIYDFDTRDAIKIVTSTLERFMDYLLLHDACPEYKTEILSTRNLCRSAESELWKCSELQRKLPGDFNRACSLLFNETTPDYYQQRSDTEPTYNESDWNALYAQTSSSKLDPARATQIVGFAIAGAATESVYESYLSLTTGDNAGQGFEITKTITDHGFEVTQMIKPSEECLDLYQKNTKDFDAVGTVTCKFFRNPDAPPEDYSPDEKVTMISVKDDMEFTFFIEGPLVQSLLHVGMRIKATIHQLNCGVWFFDNVLRVLPSFDMWIENELMVGWKEPKWIEGVGAIDYGGSAEEERKENEGGDDRGNDMSSTSLPDDGGNNTTTAQMLNEVGTEVEVKANGDDHHQDSHNLPDPESNDTGNDKHATTNEGEDNDHPY